MRMEVDNQPSENQLHDSDDNNNTNSQSPSKSPSPTHPSANPIQSPIDTNSIPDSVRGAPEELKPAIRKKQNKEVSFPSSNPAPKPPTNTPWIPQSARRSRRRRKELVQNLGNNVAMLIEKTQELETRLDSIERFLSKSGFEPFSHPRLQYPVLSTRSLPTSDAGPSHSGSLGIGSDAGSQSRGHASASAQSQGTREIDDQDVEKLIASCLEQL